MDKKLEEVLNALNKINTISNVVSQEEINEQYENLQDFKTLSNELEGLLNNFKSVSIDNVEKVENILFEIHRITNTFIWHFQEIEELNMKVIKSYGKEIKIED
ncbi:hypothetical protein [Salipaludibacillus agaradhaerens]|uniref:hypothetical protein n=1 Tax=Salipaludibacillus agaradhaerens TaxID=76935 RepID=UPI00099854B5|nr:hypothetical protein [Salipaludibacillus agaradhaerens]